MRTWQLKNYLISTPVCSAVCHCQIKRKLRNKTRSYQVIIIQITNGPYPLGRMCVFCGLQIAASCGANYSARRVVLSPPVTDCFQCITTRSTAWLAAIQNLTARAFCEVSLFYVRFRFICKNMVI